MGNKNRLTDELVNAIHGAGFSVSGPTDHRAAEEGEPVWVCNAREALAVEGERRTYIADDPVIEVRGRSYIRTPLSRWKSRMDRFRADGSLPMPLPWGHVYWNGIDLVPPDSIRPEEKSA
jgi:hypothetical protein